MGYIKKLFFVFMFSIVLSTSLAFCNDEIKLVPVGKVVYIHCYLKSPIVEDILSDYAKNLKKKDVVLSITCKSRGKVTSLEDMQNIMRLEKEKIKVKFIRKGKTKSVSMTSDELRLYKLDCVTGGIGTITAINENGEFIGLAHELSCVKNNLGFEKINIYETDFIQQRKSDKDDVGFLVTNTNGKLLGNITSVDEFGVKGNYTNFKYDPSEALSIAKPKVGRAYIFCSDSITNELKLHEIKITDVNNSLSSIKILDDSLIKFRGGIVKGMSGSPVIQDNKIVGGVRSTKISNPKEGYISNIDNMLGISLD
ncbi:SpoIVB peptidase S55 domain-containing protein [Romboutsia sp.]|uniref:SpoIVB peptidase S55 domain-containing protein n=1 Tax=Romboutsia sp. TaxID=1965302 RepID=UPI002BB0869F|nr:SpoIVB peptidase S55 domain-containing protein [Romboutsia sp.]HSQ88312.1 SpoIVB peptidase S55 domain-containing protein [Romboutsia sp.]